MTPKFPAEGPRRRGGGAPPGNPQFFVRNYSRATSSATVSSVGNPGFERMQSLTRDSSPHLFSEKKRFTKQVVFLVRKRDTHTNLDCYLKTGSMEGADPPKEFVCFKMCARPNGYVTDKGDFILTPGQCRGREFFTCLSLYDMQHYSLSNNVHYIF